MKEIGKIVETCCGKGKDLSESAQKVLNRVEQLPEDDTENVEVSAEVLEELKKSVSEAMKEQALPVYGWYAVFFCELPLGPDEKAIIERAAKDMEGCYEPWDSDIDNQYQDIVNEILEEYVGGVPSMGEELCISDREIVLNFDMHTMDDKIYSEDAMRRLADALNRLLGDRYITSFSLF